MKTSLITTSLLFGLATCLSSRPHIIVFLPDDWGYNDVGYHNPSIQTPNIDMLSAQGVRLEQNYVQPVCTPTRSALLTGMYPYHIGRQGLVLFGDAGSGLTLERKLLPEALKELGYATHMVGKWHLGHCHENYLPTKRGFDTHLGYWCGLQDYYNKSYYGYDFHDGLDLVTDQSVKETYSGFIYRSRINSIIRDHDAVQPLFFYVAFQNPHYPLSVPKVYEDMYPNVANPTRKTFSGLVTSMDEIVGDVVKALVEKDMYDNSILILMGDNGGIETYGGSNYPLKGGKGSVDEGGTRTPAFIHSPLLQKAGYESYKKIHVVDWLPTLLRAANATDDVWSHFKDIDGIDQFDTLFQDDKEVRQEFVYNIGGDMSDTNGAIRLGDYKLKVTSRSAEEFEIYNIVADPMEQNDLINQTGLIDLLLPFYDSQALSMVPEDPDRGVGFDLALDLEGNHITGYCSDPREGLNGSRPSLQQSQWLVLLLLSFLMLLIQF